MSVRPIRIGFVGCGSALRYYFAVAEQLRKQGLAEVVAACDVVEARREHVLQEFGVESFSTDFRDIVQSDQIDLVLVLTPDLLHGPVVLEALEAGKHVLVEKPMALALEETSETISLDQTMRMASQIAELAKSGPGYLICAPFVILSKTYQMIWRHIQQGEIGRVLTARARYGDPMPDQAWVYRPGGGPLFNIAIYNITSLTGFLGPVQRVMAMTGIAIGDRQIDDRLVHFEAEEDTAQIVLDFGNSVFAAVTTGWTIQRYCSPAIELYGAEGTIQLLGDDWSPNGYEMWRRDMGCWQRFPEADPCWSWADGLRYFVECIHKNTPPMAMLDHARHVLEILLKVKASSRDGSVQQLESTFSHADLNKIR